MGDSKFSGEAYVRFSQCLTNAQIGKPTHFPPPVGRFAAAVSILRFAVAPKNVRSGNDIK